jgi:hypothetical protein
MERHTFRKVQRGTKRWTERLTNIATDGHIIDEQRDK